MVKPTKKKIAEAIGVSQPMVSKYVRQGMPVYSIEAAIRWREQHIDPLRRKEWLLGTRAGPSTEQLLDRVARLFDLAAVNYARHEADLRAALRAVPPRLRPTVPLRVDVAHKLLAPALAVGADLLQPGADMPEDEAEEMGAIVYAICAGEIIASGGKWLISPAAAHLFHADQA